MELNVALYGIVTVAVPSNLESRGPTINTSPAIE